MSKQIKLMSYLIIIASIFLLLDAGSASAATPIGRISVAIMRPGNVIEFTGTTNQSQVHSKIGNTWGAWVPSSRGKFDLKANIPIGNSQMCVYVMNSSGTQTKIGCVNLTGYPLVNAAQLNTEIGYIDPSRTVNWQLVVPPNPISWSGEAIPWQNKILISKYVFSKDVRATVRHEWGHELQWRYFGSTAVGWTAGLNHLNSISDTTDGIEHSADCIAIDIGASSTDLAYGCLSSLVPISQSMVPAKQPSRRR